MISADLEQNRSLQRQSRSCRSSSMLKVSWGVAICDLRGDDGSGLSVTGVGIDVPTIGDLFHITKTAISVGDDLYPLSSWVM